MEVRITVESTNNLSLSGVWHVPASQTEEQEKKIVVLCHGFMMTKDSNRFEYYAAELTNKGYNTLCFDFSGCGESDKAVITVKQEVDDLKSITSFCASRGFNEIIMLGHSLGGLVVLQSYPQLGKTKKVIKSLVLLAPTTYPKIPAFFTEKQLQQIKNNETVEVTNSKGFKATINKQYIKERQSVDTKKLFSGITVPLLFFQGKKDEHVDWKKSQDASKFFPKASEMMIYPQADHNFHDHKEKIMKKIFEWFEKIGF